MYRPILEQAEQKVERGIIAKRSYGYQRCSPEGRIVRGLPTSGQQWERCR